MTRIAIVHAAVLAAIAALFAPGTAFSADLETPVAISNVTAVVAPGEVIENATILVEGDRISAVGRSVDVPRYAETLDGSGLWAYAGFIDATSHLGIEAKEPSKEELARLRDREQDVSQAPRTHMQKANRQEVWPHLTIYDLYEQDDDALAAYRKGGFTTALVSPHPAVLGGKGDVVQLGGQAIRSSIVAPAVTQIVQLAPDLEGSAWRTRKYPASPMGVAALLRQTYLDAQWYRERHAQYQQYPTNVDRVVFDPVLEAMGGLLDRREMWLVVANEPNEIHHALDLANELNQRVVVLGAKEGWKVADRLAAENVPVIVSLEWPDKPKLAPKKKDDEGATYTTASWTPEWEEDFFEPRAVREARLQDWKDHVNNLHALIQAGVPVAVSTRDAENPQDFWKRAAEALELSLTEDELLGAMTTGPASIFRLHNQLGRIDSGYLANLTLRTKPLGDKDGQVRHVFIDGERFSFTVTAKADDDAEKDEETAGDEEPDTEAG